MKSNTDYRLVLTNGLPPGTDNEDQLYASPRLPRPAPRATRPVPEWPPINKRNGKWIAPYLDTLDPETEFDHIIRTSSLFGVSKFGASLAYTVIICINSQTPAGAAAVHGGRVVTGGHSRYYRTQLSELKWLINGSTAPETASDIARINKLHGTVWKRKPGTFSSVWEAKMTVIGISYFDTWVRKVAGAACQEPHHKIQQAYPRWGEQLTSHFRTEPSHGSQSFGNNYPRTWLEVEEFFFWLQEFAFEEQTTDDQKKIGAEAAESFVKQFCELWFPQPLQFIGRNIILTFTPPKCRARQAMGNPNWFLEKAIKLISRVYFNVSDSILSDPSEPTLVNFRDYIANLDIHTIDRKIEQLRRRQGRLCSTIASILLICIATFVLSLL